MTMADQSFLLIRVKSKWSLNCDFPLVKCLSLNFMGQSGCDIQTSLRIMMGTNKSRKTSSIVMEKYEKCKTNLYVNLIALRPKTKKKRKY